jgi:hypothetical protein
MQTNNVTNSKLIDKLEQLATEAETMMVLGYDLKNEIREALRQLQPTYFKTLREAGRAYIATASNRELRGTLIEMRGDKAAANFRTRLNGDPEQRRGRRHPVNGQARVHGNGAHSAV